MLRMGVTTAVGGNCGINVYDPSDYLNLIDREGAAVNVAMYAGHEYFRKAAGAADIYAGATEQQLAAMEEGIRRALDNGCVGCISLENIGNIQYKNGVLTIGDAVYSFGSEVRARFAAVDFDANKLYLEL